MLTVLFLIIAAAALVYAILLGLYVGFGTLTSLSWFAAALGSGVLSALAGRLKKKGGFRSLPLALRTFLITSLLLFLAVFLLTEAFILSGMRAKPAEDADYVVVLGARVNGTVPSYSLQLRLDRALAYVQAHPQCRVIVSGGQGADEDVTEAQAMYRYLVDHGVQAGRIIREGSSRTTVQNLTYSLNYVRDGESVVIVSSDYHVFRAVEMAGKLRPDLQISGLPARNPGLLIPHSVLREFLAVIKAKFMGQI